MMVTQAISKKSLVLGVDAMDPLYTKRLLAEGRMPNTAKLIERGACREDLDMLGGIPTVTPPMWTTLATGAYPCTHGITQYNRINWERITHGAYNMDSRLCKAEPLWNVAVEAGIKTLVFHWPGSSWPPTSDSPLLHVVDGTQPAAVNMGIAQVESEFLLVASDRTDFATYRAKAATDGNVPCVNTDLVVAEYGETVLGEVSNPEQGMELIVLSPEEGTYYMSKQPYDVVLSPLKDATGWEAAPADAKEFTMLFAEALSGVTSE